MHVKEAITPVIESSGRRFCIGRTTVGSSRSMSCIYCGNNPVNHTSMWWGNKLTLLLSLRTSGSTLQRVASRIAHILLRGILGLFSVLGIARFTSDASQAASHRGAVLWEEAIARGINMQAYVVGGKVSDTYRACVGNRTILFSGIPRPSVSKSGSELWLDDKWRLKQELIKQGVPVARGYECTSLSDALEAFQTLEKPLITKPRLGSRGRHTTTHIYTEEQLREGFVLAYELCPSVIVEEHLMGAVYRGTVVGGKVVGVLSGEPPRVVGDGAHTIRELVERKNSSRHADVSAITLGEQHERFLARLGYSFDSIPKEGKVLDLLEKIGVSYGGHSAEVTPHTHSDIIAALESAAKAVDDPMMGFDFIVADISQSPDAQKWGFIECNSNPFINLHHDPVEGTPINAAAAVWDYVETHSRDF